MCRERSDVWGFLKAHGIRELPVHGRELAQEMQIQIIDYEVGAVLLHRLGLDELKARKEGFSVQTENHAYIFMRRGLSKARENHIILHEIGHFAAGHNDLLAHAAEKRTAAEERAAEEYVYEMAPTPVLYAAGFTTLEDIRRITGLEASTARRILTRVPGGRTADFKAVLGFYSQAAQTEPPGAPAQIPSARSGRKPASFGLPGAAVYPADTAPAVGGNTGPDRPNIPNGRLLRRGNGNRRGILDGAGKRLPCIPHLPVHSGQKG